MALSANYFARSLYASQSVFTKVSKMINIALPSGRIREQVRTLLDAAGIHLDFGSGDRSMMPRVYGDQRLKFFVVRSKDAAALVKQGRFDAAFLGGDMVEEVDAESEVETLVDTEADPIKLVVAARESERELLQKCLRSVPGCRMSIVTKYPRLVGNWLSTRGCTEHFQLVEVEGSVEVYAHIDENTVIADVTASGDTLRSNGLYPIETIRSSTTLFVANRKRLAIPEINDALRFKAYMLKGVIEAGKREMLSVNATHEVEQAVSDILRPAGMRTVDRIPSADGKSVSLSIAILSSRKYEILQAATAAGATDPVVLPIKFLA